MSTNPAERLYTSYQVGTLLQMDPSSIVKWVNDGILHAYYTPGGHRRIRSTDLLAFLRQHEMYIPAELKGGPSQVLVVDDDDSFLKALARALKPRKDQFEINTCTSGIEALVRVGANRPDVLVIDVHMPDFDGFDVLRTLKSNEATRGIEVILFTGKPSPELEKKALSMGARALLAKPLTPAALADAVVARHQP